MRVVGGTWRGRALRGPTGGAIRPTSDRLREAIFNVLLHRLDDPVTGTRVLDLFAGTGAMGLEALSRGAVFATFVDTGAEARGLVRANVEALGCAGTTRLLRRDATALGPCAPASSHGLVFCDPPYGRDLAPAALAGCLAGGWLEPGAVAVVEERAGEPLTLPAPFRELDRRAFSGSQVVFARLEG